MSSKDTMKNIQDFKSQSEVEAFLIEGWEIFINDRFITQELYEQLQRKENIEWIKTKAANDLLETLQNPSTMVNKFEEGTATFKEWKASLVTALKAIQELLKESPTSENMDKIHKLSSVTDYFNLFGTGVIGKNHFTNVTTENYMELKSIAFKISELIGYGSAAWWETVKQFRP